MDFTDVNIKVPIGMTMYITPQNKQNSKEMHCFYIHILTIKQFSMERQLKFWGFPSMN